MKTVDQIKEEIQTLQQNTVKPKQNAPRKEHLAYSRMQNRVSFLYGCQLYLESGPREEFVKEEVERLGQKLVRIDDNFEQWVAANRPAPKSEEDEKMYLKAYRKEMEVSEINKRIKHLKFLLQ